MKSTTTFSIETTQSPTGKPFGNKYAGVFAIRRPTLMDKKTIALRNAVSLASEGEVDPSLISDGMKLVIYIFAYMSVVAEQPLPEWFDMETMTEPEDEDAVFAVWAEVSKFADSFRPKASGNDSQPGGDQPTLLVQE